MTTTPPPWQAHAHPDYDRLMSAKSAGLLGEIAADQSRRRAILADPREVHRELFAGFAPRNFAQYAGGYRGSPDPALSGRVSVSSSQLAPGTTYAFCAPAEVAGRMSLLLGQTESMMQEMSQATSPYEKLLLLTYTFCWFGKIHPFLDGNGHVQRAVFASMAAELGLPLSKRFAIHPRPYDRLMAIALELFTRAPTGEETAQISLVAEYLAFFLSGPFEEPRAHLPLASPY